MGGLIGGSGGVGATAGGAVGTVFGPAGTAVGSIIGGFAESLIGGKQKYVNAAASLSKLAAAGAPKWFQDSAYQVAYFPETKPLGDKQRILMEIAAAATAEMGGAVVTDDRRWAAVASKLGLGIPSGLSYQESVALVTGGGGGGGGGPADSGGAVGFGGGSGPLLAVAAVVLLWLVLQK